MRKVKGALDAILFDLSRPKQPLDNWAEPILKLLLDVYGDEPLDENQEPGRTIVLACGQIHEVLKTHLEIDKSLVPTVTGASALRILLRQLEGEAIPPQAAAEAIELLGWLELIWDDAPAVIICGFNEGTISPSVGGDLFLPNALRQRLGLDDNDRRLARDKYALGLLAASRERLHLIAGRRSPENDPLVPSRLLFACADGELARRTLRLFSAPGQASPRILLPGSLQPGRGRSNLPIPMPDSPLEAEPIFRVTEFRDYLACPYRYYLRHRLKLKALADSASELDARQFGNLLHEALMDFGRSEIRDSTNPDEIRDHLFLALGELAATAIRQWRTAGRAGANRAAQVATRGLCRQASRAATARLEDHACRKGVRQRDGNEKPAHFVVDDQPAFLCGRVDRIDQARSVRRVGGSGL